ncbi:Juvenile hormone epoxide hydrolase 2 [Araneus ventricosus]|uniref:Juvenile hormone epoxide hydrolase 2 n=1 Tax=Araneus ventricosus TaxID=182803 RepID=A0A4Y2UQN8_ARAVE|nr:Juvenile hormone epoxide hydrolase 2 [Araneus ventricosus]
MIFYRKNNKATDLYRKVWRKRNSHIESKDIDEDASSIRPFKICVPDSVLDDLKSRLGRARLNTPSRNDNFYNGFNPEHLRKLTDYWKTKFDWRRREQELNKYPQFKTKIGDIDVHFLQFKASQHDFKLKMIPLLLIHNWPGSFADFQKVIPILQTSCVEHGFVFEIVCPSIPGCGFSEAPHQSGM